MKKIKLGLIILSAIILVATLAACSGQKAEEQKNSSISENEQSKQATSETTVPKETQKASDANAPTSEKKQYAVIETNRGRIVFQLLTDKAPKTVDNFIKLANSGFYNGIKWHRVEPGFVIQGGDPLSKDNDPSNDGLGGPGYTIPAEINDAPHLRGTVAMAHNSIDINSAGSQFYICLTDQPRLNGKYTVFGQVTEGLNVVDQIQKYDVMQKVYIETK